MREHEQGKKSQDDAASAPAKESDPQLQQARAQVAEWRKEFQQLTGVNPTDGEAVKTWQLKHGVPPTGKIRAMTIAAARAASKKKSEPQAGGTDAFEGEGVASGGEVDNPLLMDNITDGAAGEEKREKASGAETLGQAGGAATQAKEGLDVMAGATESPWVKAAMAPAIVAQLKDGDYLGAARTLALTFSPSEYFEGLTFACEKLGLHAGVKVFARIAAMGLELNVGLELVMWTYEGFLAIHEAHEKGDRDSRIAMYAAAFADTFLSGRDAGHNPGAITPEQKEAVELGRRDGAATAGKTGVMAPVIGKELLKKFGGAHQARQAIINELLQKAGFSDVRV